MPSVFSLPTFWTWCLLYWRGLFHCLFLQQNSLSLLTGSAPSAASFCFYFSYSVSLGERIIYHRLRELYVLVLCVLVFLHSLCGFNNFFWFEGCFWFGCLPSVSSACAELYPLDRWYADAQPLHTPREAGPVVATHLWDPQWWQWSVPAFGDRDGRGISGHWSLCR